MAVREQEAVAASQSPRPGPRGALGRWASTTFASLSLPDHRTLWIGTLFTFFTITLVMTAQSVVAYDLTGNNRAVGSVMFAQGVAMLFLAPLAGAVADRLSKRLLMIAGQSILSAGFFLIGALILADAIEVWHLAATAFVTGVMFAVVRTARNAIIGEMVPLESRGNALALQQLALSMMQIVAPFLAGALIAWEFVGAGGTYVIGGIASTITVLTTTLLPSSAARPAGNRPNIFRDVALGLVYAWRNPQIRWSISALLFVTLTGMPFMTLLPGYTKEALGVDTAGLGVLMGVSAIGGLTLSLAVASSASSARGPVVLTACIALLGISLVGLGAAPNFVVAACVMLFLGAGMAGFQMLNNALAVRDADPAYYGRIIALTMMGFSLSSLVALPIGALADEVGVRPVLATMGICVAAAALVLRLWYAAIARSRAGAAA